MKIFSQKRTKGQFLENFLAAYLFPKADVYFLLFGGFLRQNKRLFNEVHYERLTLHRMQKKKGNSQNAKLSEQ